LIIVMESGHKESLSSEFPAVRDRLHLLSEIVDGVPYDIPDPAQPGIDPTQIGREIALLIGRGKEKILQLAKSLSKSSSS
jgi:protein-tyrosine-phosphatase